MSVLRPQDIAENRWGMQLRAYFHTGTDSFTIDPPKGGDTAAFVPRTRAALLTSEHATVLAFRGSEPTNLINLRSAGRCAGQSGLLYLPERAVVCVNWVPIQAVNIPSDLDWHIMGTICYQACFCRSFVECAEPMHLFAILFNLTQTTHDQVVFAVNFCK